MGKICLECHYENNDDATFCEHCGKKIVSSISEAAGLKCENCGARLDLKSNFCSKCGSDISKVRELSGHDRTQRMIDANYNSMEKVNKSLIWVFIVIAAVISLIMMISYFGENGFLVLLIPIGFAVIGLIAYFEIKIKNKIYHFGFKTMNDVINKKK